MAAVLIYVTSASRNEAMTIGRTLIAEKLAACANVFAPMTSIYWWEGAVVESSEAVLLLKTDEARSEGVCARIKEIHSYQCPCVLVVPVIAGNSDFLEWIRDEVAT